MNTATLIPFQGPRQYLVASDFDQTLSFNDSGFVLSELLGIRDFDEKVAGLAQTNLVEQGAVFRRIKSSGRNSIGIRARRTCGSRATAATGSATTCRRTR